MLCIEPVRGYVGWLIVVWKHCWHLNRFGVCCVFIFTNSNSAINQNNSYIQNPSFPAGYTGTTGLTYTINKCASSKYLLYKNHIGTGRHTWSLEGVKVLKLFGGIFIFPLTKTKIIGHLKPIDTSRDECLKFCIFVQVQTSEHFFQFLCGKST